MADFNQFGSAKPAHTGDPQHCAHCEAMLADALDGTLSAADQSAFDLHMVGCATCASMFDDAQRGAAWLEMLKSPPPEPPIDLMERILAQTATRRVAKPISRPHPSQSPLVLGPTAHIRHPNTLLGQPMLASTAAASRNAAFASTKVLPFRSRFTNGLRSIGHTMLQPRLAMTAAMAFFSIALTLNLTGVRLSSLRASDFKPSSILRSAYDAKARVVRYSDNLRVVYELESRVRDLQHSDEGLTNSPAMQQTPATSTPNQEPDKKQPDDQNPDQESKTKPASSQSRHQPTRSSRQ